MQQAQGLTANRSLCLFSLEMCTRNGTTQGWAAMMRITALMLRCTPSTSRLSILASQLATSFSKRQRIGSVWALYPCQRANALANTLVLSSQGRQSDDNQEEKRTLQSKD